MSLKMTLENLKIFLCVCWTSDFLSFFHVKHEGVGHCGYYCSLVCQLFVVSSFCNCPATNEQVVLNPRSGPNTVFIIL